jgi:Dimerisation domain
MKSPKQARPKLSPVQVWQDLMVGAWRGHALAAAVELDLFTRIGEGNTTPQKIAAAAGSSEHGTPRLLDALSGIGYLKKSRQTYRLTPMAAEFLVRGKPLYMGSASAAGKMLAGAWSSLATVVREGRQMDRLPGMDRRSAAGAGHFGRDRPHGTTWESGVDSGVELRTMSRPEKR